MGIRIGLTGGIGSGKSTVAAMLAACGAKVVDVDVIARSLTAPGGAAMPVLVAALGPQIMSADGALNRSLMRQWAFQNPDIKAQLESILHPMITRRALAEIDAVGSQTVVVDIPLLAESPHWRSRLDRVLVVDCSVATQVQRVRERSGWTDAQIQQVIAQQATREQRLAIADEVIWNEGVSLQKLRVFVENIWNHWQSL